MTVPSRCEFTHLRPGPGPSRIRAKFTLHYGDFVMTGFEVREHPGGGLYVGLPRRQDRGGWITTVFLPDPERKKAFEKWVLHCYAQDVRETNAASAASV